MAVNDLFHQVSFDTTSGTSEQNQSKLSKDVADNYEKLLESRKKGNKLKIDNETTMEEMIMETPVIAEEIKETKQKHIHLKKL